MNEGRGTEVWGRGGGETELRLIRVVHDRSMIVTTADNTRWSSGIAIDYCTALIRETLWIATVHEKLVFGACVCVCEFIPPSQVYTLEFKVIEEIRVGFQLAKRFIRYSLAQVPQTFRVRSHRRAERGDSLANGKGKRKYDFFASINKSRDSYKNLR